jgi:hypothetical protein
VLLQSRYASSTKKLALETKMRDAARSLASLNSQNKSMSKQTQDQLDVASRRLELVQADHARVRDRAAEVQRKLLEHRAGVLSAALRRAEEDAHSDGRLSVPSSMAMSPATATSATSVSTLSKFDGAHLFAGHADAAVPASPRGPVSSAELEALQERVRTAEASAKVAARKVAELGRDLGLLQLEKAEAETTAALEVQQAEEQVSELRRELAKLERGQAQGDEWGREREELLEDISQRDGQIEELQRRIDSLEADVGGRDRGAEAQADEELEVARKALRGIVRAQRLNMRPTTESESERGDASVYSVANMVAAIAAHVESLDEGKKALEKGRRDVELQVRDEQSAREKLARQLDESRQDNEESHRQIQTLEYQMKVSLRLIESASRPILFIPGAIRSNRRAFPIRKLRRGLCGTYVGGAAADDVGADLSLDDTSFCGSAGVEAHESTIEPDVSKLDDRVPPHWALTRTATYIRCRYSKPPHVVRPQRAVHLACSTWKV